MIQFSNNDTIVALSTAPGVGAIGVIRLSGEDAITIADKVFRGKKLVEQDTHTLHFGSIKKGDEIIDEVVVGLFKAPHSYTKENVVEISCHGSPYIQQRIIELLIEEGARLAQPGEFTMRAFLNGQMDLSQAEAVADLIAANSASAHQLALQQMRGGYSGKIVALREKLVHFASMIELELDFAEEDVEFADRDDLKTLIHEIQKLLQKLIHSFQLGNVLKNGVTTVIAGRPNAGKSTLLNALLQEERAIVSDIPGTTRDTIEEILNIEGIQFRLIDTAGIRDATDKIEQMGVQRTMEKIGQSSIVVYVFDVEQMNEKVLKEDLEKITNPEIPIIIVGNKSDLIPRAELEEKFVGIENIIFLSSKEEENVDTLIQALLANVEQQEEGGVVVSNARHYQALKRANDSLNEVLQGLDNNISGELLALDIRRGLESLGEITGEVTTDDLLGNIFSKFCIGK